MTYTIAQIPTEERPRERFLTVGPEAMATSELLAILLGSGMAGKSVLDLSRELLAHFGSLDGVGAATIEELCEVNGIGPAKAIQLRAAFTLTQRLTSQTEPNRPHVRSPLHAYLLVKDELERETRELFQILLLDTKGRYLRTETVAVGSLSEAIVHPREVFYPAIRHKAASLVLVHNHPSGDPTPSPEDIVITERLIRTGEVVGIRVNDHLIVGRDSYRSLREEGSATF